MRKIKMFVGTSTNEIEEQVNEWLENNITIQGFEIQMQINDKKVVVLISYRQ